MSTLTPRVQALIRPALPWLLAALVLALGVLYLEQARRHSDAELRAELEVTARQLGSRLGAWFNDRSAILAHFADMRSGRPLDRKALQQVEQQAFIDRVPGFLAINWVDTNGVIRDVVPRAANEAALGRNLREHPLAHIRTALARALDQGLPARTGRIPLFQGGDGISVYWPVRRTGPDAAPGSGGAINGVFRIGALIADALPDAGLHQRFHIALVDARSGLVFANSEANGSGKPWQTQVEVQAVDEPLQLLMSPQVPPPLALNSWLYGVWLAVLVAVATGLGLLSAGYLRYHLRLQQQENHIRLLMDATVEGVVGVDLQGCCTFSNAAAARAVGYAEAAGMQGRDVLNRLVQAGERRSEGRFSTAGRLLAGVAEGRLVRGTARLQRMDGSQADVEYSARPVRADGVITGALVTFTDISAEADEAARAARLEALVEQVPELVLITDAKLKLIHANPATLNRLAIDPGAATGIDLFQVLPPELHDDVDQLVGPVVRAKGIWRGELTLLSSTGERIPVEMTAMGHTDHAGEQYYSAVCRDLSEQRQLDMERNDLERQFQQAQRTESLGLLAGGIAHDFNNMLTGVLGNASLALDLLPPDSPVRDKVLAVETATQRAADLTRQLLAYSGRGSVTLGRTNLGDLVAEMAGLLRASIPQRVSLDVDTGAEDDAATAVVIDPTQIRQLVMNLITNAADAIAGDGQVQIRVARRFCDPASFAGTLFGDDLAAAEHVVLEVQDTGTGMHQDVQERIFDPFFTTKDTGKGLGLSAALGIVRSHGAVLNLASHPGSGTCFRVVFPHADSTEQAAGHLGQAHLHLLGQQPAVGSEAGLAQASEPVPASGNPLVLVVDDEAPVRDFLVVALGSMNLDALVARSGEEAVQLAQRHQGSIALVLLDQTMPGMNGAATWRAIRRHGCTAPGVLMSGYDQEHMAGTLEELGFAAFLQKPFRVAALKDLVSRALQQHAA